MKIVLLCCTVELLALAAGVVLDLNTIILAIIGLIGTSITGFIALRMASMAADAKLNREAAIAAASDIKLIHTATNSGLSAMTSEVKSLTATVLKQAETIKTLEENKRGAELAKAVSDAQAPVVIQAPPPAQV